MHRLQEGTGEQAAMSPDGMRIVFEKQEELWEMGPNGENPTRLADAPRASHFYGHAGFSNCSWLSWSSDGRWLTYLRKVSDTDALVLEALSPSDGKTATVLDDPDLRGYAWISPNQMVLNRWEARDRPFSNLWQIKVDPTLMRALGKPRRLTNWAGFSIENMSGSRDAGTLAASKETDRSDTFIGELTDHGDRLTGLRRISVEDRIEWPGGWGRDGKWLFFQSDRTGNMNVFRQRFDSENSEPVVTTQDDNRAPLLSPDGQSILYFAWPRSAPQVTAAKLMRKPLAGGRPEVILEAKGLPGSAQTSYRVVLPTMTGQPAFRCPSSPISPCVLSEGGPSNVVFSSFAPVPHAAKAESFRIQAEDPDGVAWDLSPDGSRIAYAEHDWQSALIHIRELGQRRTRDLRVPALAETATMVWSADDRNPFWTRDVPLPGLAELSTLSWSADGKSLFFTTFAVTGSTLFHLTLDGRYRILYKGAKEVEGPRESPDGRHLAFGDVVSASNVWLIEGIPR